MIIIIVVNRGDIVSVFSTCMDFAQANKGHLGLKVRKLVGPYCFFSDTSEKLSCLLPSSFFMLKPSHSLT